jgi:ribonuclease BN (tRNA processing enzyme)
LGEGKQYSDGSSDDSSSGVEYESEEGSEYTDSVGTVTAEELLKTCTTNMDDVSLNEEELEKAMKEMDMSNKKLDVKVWKPPSMCTRSKDKKYLYANPYGMTTEEVKLHNKWSQRKLRDDSKFDEIYEGAERLTETLKQIEKNKKAFAERYGVKDVDEYFHQKSVAFGWEREVDAEELAREGLAEDEEAYFQVKPRKRPGINRFVKIVHKRSKSG